MPIVSGIVNGNLAAIGVVDGHGNPPIPGADDVVLAGVANEGPFMAAVAVADDPTISVAADNNLAIPEVANNEPAENSASVEELLMGDVNKMNSQGWTAFHTACFAKRLDMMELLHFELKADIAIHTLDGLSPLMLACKAYLTQPQHLLVTKNIHDDTVQAQPSGEVSIRREDFAALCNMFATQCYVALDNCVIGTRRCCDEMLRTDHPVAQNKLQLFQAHWSCIEILRLRIQVNCVEARIWTQHHEVLQQCNDIISRSEEHQKSCIRWSNEGWIEGDRLLIEYEVIEGQSKGIRLMCNEAEQQQNAGEENLQVQQQHEAATLTPRNTDTRVINWLLDNRLTNVNAVDNNGNTALHYIITHGSSTELHKACHKGDVSWIKKPWMLLNVNAQDDNGRTPLHLAAMNGHMHAVRALIAWGADEHLLDDDGLTAADLADKFAFPLVANEIMPRM